MNEIIIDTSGYSAFVRGDREVQSCINKATLIVVSPIMIGELLIGFIKGNREQENRERLDDFCAMGGVFLVDVDEDTAERYAVISNTLREQGTPIPVNDIWLAALAWQHGYKILTRDSHFSKIPQVMLAK